MKTWSISEDAVGEYNVTYADGDSVFPTTHKRTRREAAARLLQLMDLGPIAPQIEPEEVKVGAFIEEPAPKAGADGEDLASNPNQED